MKEIVLDGIDMLQESLMLLNLIAASENPKERELEIRNKYGVSSEELKEPFRVVGKLCDAGRKALKKDMEKVREYFLPYQGEDYNYVCKGYFAVLWDVFRYGETIEERKEFCLSRTEEERCWIFYDMMNLDEYHPADYGKMEREDCKTFVDMLECLEQSEFSKEQRWEIQWVFQHQEEAFAQVEPLIKKAWKVLEDERKLWQPLQKEFTKRWRKRLKTVEFWDYMEEEMGGRMDENPLGLVVMPQIVGTRQMFLSSDGLPNEHPRKCQDIMRIGLVVEILGFGKRQDFTEVSEKYLASMLKLLADESKLGILARLKKHKYYGGELAKDMNLTPATISHHMNDLLGNGLVTVEKEQNRVYYCIHEENIRKLLEQAGQFLLNQPE